MNAETLLICGTDPYETKTILWTQWIMKGIQNGQKAIMMIPRRTAGVAYAEKNGGLWLDVQPGTDLLVSQRHRADHRRERLAGFRMD